MRDLGLNDFIIRFKEENIGLQAFQAFSASRSDSKQSMHIKHILRQKIGLSQGQILSICDQLTSSQVIRQNMTPTYSEFSNISRPISNNNYGGQSNITQNAFANRQTGASRRVQMMVGKQQ